MNQSDNAVKDVDFPKTNKIVIILTYSFPPDNRISALRPFKMAEAFSKKGWDVHVLRCENNGADKNGFKDLSNIKVSGFRSSWLSGFLAGDFKAGRGILGGGSLFVKLLRRLFLPDHSFLMRKHMEDSLNKLSATYNPSCIVSISYPFVSHLAAKSVVELNAKPVWVADNRDMWSGNPYRGINFCPAFIERNIESRVLGAADIVTFAADETRKIYEKRYGLPNALAILNGFEGARVLKKSTPQDKQVIRFVHTGSLYNGKRTIEPLILAAKRLASDLGVKCQIILYGDGCNHLHKTSRCMENGLLELKLMGVVSRDEAYTAQDEADFLVVAMADVDFDKTYVPAKIFEYARAGKPVVSICDPESELANITNAFGLGVAGFSSDAIFDYVLNWFNGFEKCTTDLDDKVDQLSAEYQFGKLVNEVDRLLSC